jgi:hypothetical protein
MNEEIRAIRSQIADRALIGLSIVTVPALTASLYRIVDIGWLPVMGVHIAAAVSIFAITFGRR